jgi:hypothetical protein
MQESLETRSFEGSGPMADQFREVAEAIMVVLRSAADR